MIDYSEYIALGFSNKIGIGTFYEDILERIYRHLTLKSTAVIDGGVNCGRHTFPLSECVGRHGLVIGFEAQYERVLEFPSRSRTKDIANIQLVNKALSNFIGETEFIIVESCNGLSGIRQRIDLSPELKQSCRKISLSATTIDHELLLINSSLPVSFIKLDLEGGEFNALKGAINTLRYHQPLVIFEDGKYVSGDLYEYTEDQWFSFFESIGYDLYDIFGRQMTSQAWRKNSPPWNTIAVPSGNHYYKAFIGEHLPAIVRESYSALI